MEATLLDLDQVQRLPFEVLTETQGIQYDFVFKVITIGDSGRLFLAADLV